MSYPGPLAVYVRESAAAHALFDREMRYLAFSERWVEDFDLDAEVDYLGRNHYDVFPEIGDAWKAVHQRCLQGETVVEERDLFVRADGREQWVRYEVRPWHTDDGEIGGIAMRTEDITALVEAERKADHTGGLLQRVLDGAPLVVYAFDADGTVTLSRGRALSAVGLGNDEAVGQSVWEFAEPGSDDEQGTRSVLAGESATWTTRVGDETFETTGVPDGAGGGIMVSALVTEIDRAEQATAFQLADLRRVVEALATQGSFRDRSEALLAAVADVLGMEHAVLARLDDDCTCLASVSIGGHDRLVESGGALPGGCVSCRVPGTVGTVVAAQDLATSEFADEIDLEAERCRAFIGAPVQVDDEAFGTVSFLATDPRDEPFEDAALELVRLVGLSTGALVERELQAREAEAQVERIRALADAFILRSADDTEGMSGVLDRLRKRLGLDAGAVFRTRTEADEVELIASCGSDILDFARGDTAALAGTAVARSLNEGGLVVVRDLGAVEPRPRMLASVSGAGAFLGKPFSVDGETYGVLAFYSARPAEAISEADLELFEVTARWVGGLIERDLHRSRLEEAVAQLADARDRAREASEAKSLFLASMSHEIRTPMNAVIGFCDLLATTSLIPEQRDYVEAVQGAGDRLLGLIDDILDFSKIEAGRIDLDEGPVVLPDLIERVLEEVAPTAARKGVDLSYTVGATVPQRVMADEKRLLQVLSNLVSNAVKFTPEGSVSVETEVPVLYDSESRPVWVEIAVRDTGIGIPPEALERIFDPFVQADGSATRAYGGTGLGLAITRRFVDLMGGEIVAESVPGEGSTFRVRLPMRRAPAIGRVVTSPVSAALRGRRALVVDDCDDGRRALVSQLERWGMVADATGDPEEALDWIISGRPYDVGLLDMVLVRSTGLDLAERVRAHRSTDELPLVILSSEDRVRHEPDLVSATLLKPVTSSALHALLRRVLYVQPSTLFSPEIMVPSSASTLRVLVAEDEPANRALALRMLGRLGYRADIAADGLEALERIRQQTYDLVLMDVMMPELDGLEVTRRLRRELPQDCQPRVVALTARALRHDREACFAAGMDGYLPKPVRIEALRGVFDSLASG